MSSRRRSAVSRAIMWFDRRREDPCADDTDHAGTSGEPAVMDVTEAAARRDRTPEEPAPAAQAGPTVPRWPSERVLAPAVMLVLTGIAAGLPLVGNRIFYYWDDTAAAAVGIWHRVAEAVLAGRLPLLELDMWRGGNLVGEAATGMWNPLVLAANLATHQLTNLALAISLVKAGFMVLMAFGTYLVARDHGARPWAAALVGLAFPLAGYNLFMDGTAWINAQMTTALVPYVWWTARRAVHRGGSLFWVVLAGYLCSSIGSPYGLLATALVVLAVMVEGWCSGQRWRVAGVAAAGVATALVTAFVFIPLVGTSVVGYRQDSPTFNDGFLVPTLTDLFGLSNPAFQPFVTTFGLPVMEFPGLYLGWFLLPTLPWLRWGVLRDRWRPLVGLAVFGGASLVLMLGPSNLWMFRWPARLIPFFLLAVALTWAVVASGGFHRTRPVARSALSVSLVAFAGYLGWASVPDTLPRQLLGAAAVLLLLVPLLAGWASRAGGFVLLATGTVGVLALQLTWFPSNANTAGYQFPLHADELRDRFADRYQGMTVQFADLARADPATVEPHGIYRDVLFGSLYTIPEVETLTAYSGIGFSALDGAQCLNFYGSVTCPEAWERFWRRPLGGPAPLVDLLRAETVVAQHALVDVREEPAPPGWERQEVTDFVTVWRRTEPLPHPDGRVSHVPAGVEVTRDEVVGRSGELVDFTRDDPSAPTRLTFARLAWPGYSASVDGAPVPTRTGPDGLLQVELPAGMDGGSLELRWNAPGLGLGMGLLAAGLVLTAGLVLVTTTHRRRRRRSGDSEVSPVEPTRTTEPTSAAPEHERKEDHHDSGHP
ncbi:hypothetical protein C1701_10215 [Actinoalloteichus sp. AHMU CJ021]|uniref:YfhO family protein n=2 Tax=Pseudonocardiaceae TaxID=2070 RepID=A0ABT1JKX8_ACTCY|nr:hypothetical protein C1701_10215 [Actinoalloteichus sp. AHMU CJ021]MCP2332821.1 hypothetical protein [Actinoalloteichus caeruleus DSM 43889]